MSATNGKEGDVYPILVPILQDVGLSTMHYEYQYPIRKKGNNCVASHLLCLIHIDNKIQMSYPHPISMILRFQYFCGFSVTFPIPFYHHLLYNYLVIRDTPLCISECRIHLHPLWQRRL